MFDIFTDAAKRALVLAQDEAIMLGHDFVAAEHLLLGLVGPDDAPGPRLVGAIGLNPADVRGLVLARMAQ